MKPCHICKNDPIVQPICSACRSNKSSILRDEPVCNKCQCYYAYDTSKHPDYCDECYIKLLLEEAANEDSV